MEEKIKTLITRRFMKDLEKQLKMDLLEKLMGEMDEHSVKGLKKEPSVEVTKVEQEEIPVKELESMMSDKMSSEEPGPEEPELEDEEDDSEDSDFMKKLRAAKSKKLAE
jgi:hypothetical protein